MQRVRPAGRTPAGREFLRKFCRQIAGRADRKDTDARQPASPRRQHASIPQSFLAYTRLPRIQPMAGSEVVLGAETSSNRWDQAFPGGRGMPRQVSSSGRFRPDEETGCRLAHRDRFDHRGKLGGGWRCRFDGVGMGVLCAARRAMPREAGGTRRGGRYQTGRAMPVEKKAPATMPHVAGACHLVWSLRRT